MAQHIQRTSPSPTSRTPDPTHTPTAPTSAHKYQMRTLTRTCAHGPHMRTRIRTTSYTPFMMRMHMQTLHDAHAGHTSPTQKRVHPRALALECSRLCPHPRPCSCASPSMAAPARAHAWPYPFPPPLCDSPRKPPRPPFPHCSPPTT